jgi:lysophospholipase L1-like esterase
MRDSQELRIGATIFFASLALSLILSTLLVWQQSKGPLVFLGLVLVLAVLVRLSLRGPLVTSKGFVGWMLALATLNFVVVVPELALRVAGFRGEAGIQFGYPRPQEFMAFDADPRLFWKLRSSNRNVNSLGFPGHEITIPKPKDHYRILFLGDSCTQQGYPDIVEVLLNGGHAGNAKRVESITLAVSGYSSYQGRVLAELYGERLEPDLAVVYFGWNDHWQAYQAVDSQRVAPEPPSAWAKRLAVFQQSRVLQGLESLLASLKGSNKPLGEVRVPRAQYQENLRTIQRIFEKRGVPVVFISAPTSHYRLGVPDYLVEQNFVPDKSFSVTMHRSYNETVREVAAGVPGSYLLDLEHELESREDLDAIFLRDGIHFTPAGLALVARRVTDFLGEKVLAHN